MSQPLEGKVALVAGATRGPGAGSPWSWGRRVPPCTSPDAAHGPAVPSTTAPRPSRTPPTSSPRPHGHGVAVPTDHLDPAQVRALVDRVSDEQGRLDVLVNDIWGGENLFEWDSPVWQHDLDKGLRLLRLAVETHAITSHHALPLLLRLPAALVVEMTDGTDAYNRVNYRNSFFYDLAKTSVLRMAFSLGHELGPRGATAVALTPGWLRSEMMLDAFGVREDNWHDALDRVPHFAISETPRYVGRAVAALAADPDVARRNGESLDSGSLARTYGFTDLDGSRPDAWRYLVEVQDAGKPADATGYR